MFKTIKCIMSVAWFSVVLLSGCVTAATQPMAPNTVRNDECLNLKEQLVLNDEVSNLPGEPGVNPTKAAQLYKEYDRLECEAVIAQTKMKETAKASSRSKN